jgi:hypothetical protein
MDIQTELVNMVREALRREGQEFKVTAADAQAYTAQQVAALARAVGEPGYADALAAARDNVATYIASRTIDKGDSTDARALGILEGALFVLTRTSPTATA